MNLELNDLENKLNSEQEVATGLNVHFEDFVGAWVNTVERPEHRLVDLAQLISFNHRQSGGLVRKFFVERQVRNVERILRIVL
jgi:hypothetical protein